MGQWLDSFKTQVRRNLVALISLTVAVSSLAYNTWRDEKTEIQRNTRLAAFELVETLGEFQQLVNRMTYGGEYSTQIHIDGWGKAELIQALSPLVSTEVEIEGEALFSLWEAEATHLEGWGHEDVSSQRQAQNSEKRISEQIMQLRLVTLEELKSLK